MVLSRVGWFSQPIPTNEVKQGGVMTIELLRELVTKSSQVFLGIPKGHPAYESSFQTWETLVVELEEKEREEAE